MVVQISGVFSFSDFVFFCIGQYIVCIGGPNFKICFVSFMYSWFLYCVNNIFFVLGSKFQDMFFYFFLFFGFGNTFFVLGVQISGHFFYFFYFLYSAIHFLYWRSKFQDIFFYFFLFFLFFLFFFNVFLFFLFFYFFLSFFVFFVFGNTFFVLGVQISGYVYLFLFIYSYFLYSAEHFLYWRSKFQDIFKFYIRQYLSCHGGPNFRICLFFLFSLIYILVFFSCFLFFCFGQYIFLYWGSNFQDMFFIFNFMFFCIFLYWAICPLFWGFQISGYIFVL